MLFQNVPRNIAASDHALVLHRCLQDCANQTFLIVDKNDLTNTGVSNYGNYCSILCLHAGCLGLCMLALQKKKKNLAKNLFSVIIYVHKCA